MDNWRGGVYPNDHFIAVKTKGKEYKRVTVQSGEGELRLSQKYAFIEKSTIFTKSIRNFVKKKGTRECLILTKFCNGRVKIMDFSIKAYFWESLSSPSPLCRLHRNFISINWSNLCNFLSNQILKIGFMNNEHCLPIWHPREKHWASCTFNILTHMIQSNQFLKMAELPLLGNF